MDLHLTPLAAAALLVAGQYPIHDENRPAAAGRRPGPRTPERPAPPPSDAVVLFDGKDLAQWRTPEGRQPGAVEGRGRLPWRWWRARATSRPTQAFGDCQLHVEWATPDAGDGRGPGPRQQRRLPDGPLRGAGARLVREHDLPRRPGGRALRPVPAAGERLAPARRVADLRHRLPRRRGSTRAGKLLAPGAHHRPPQRRAGAGQPRADGPDRAHSSGRPTRRIPTSCPLGLQDHDDPVRFRNIWMRELPDAEPLPLPRDHADPAARRNTTSASSAPAPAAAWPPRS